MKLADLLSEMETIEQERTLEAHHDDMFFQTYRDVEALNKVIFMLQFIAAKKPSDSVKISELLKAAQVER